MDNRVRVINGVTVRDVTPEMTEEESKERAREVAEGLLALYAQRRKDKTA